MKKFLAITAALLLGSFLIAGPAMAAPTTTFFGNIAPTTNNTYSLSTSALKWAKGFFQQASTTDLTVGGKVYDGSNSSGTAGFTLESLGTTVKWVATTTLATISGTLNLTSQVTGVLPVANGGTNISSPTAAGVVLGNYAGTGYMQLATSTLGLLTTNVAEGSNQYFTNARAIASVLTGYVSGAGTISASDSILSAIQKLNGNIAALVTGVSSVSNSDSSITATPTTGAVVVSLNTAHSNSFSVLQTFSNSTTTALSATYASSTVAFFGTLNLPNVANGILKATSGVVGHAVGDTDYQNPITLTTTGTSGVSTFTGDTLNIPNYANTTYTAAWPVTLTGTVFGFNGLSTTTNLTQGFLPYVTGVNTFGQVATGTISNGTGISVTGGQSVIGSGLTITNTSPLSGLAAAFPFSFSNPTLTWLGLSTSSPGITAGQPVYATGVNTIASVASSTFLTSIGGQASGNYITALTGDVTATGPGSVAATLATVNTNTGSWGSSTAIPNFTVNGKGLITAAGTNVVIAPAGTLSGTTLNSTVVSSSLTSVGTLSALTISGNLTLSALTGTQCLQEISGVVSGTGSACGSGGGTTYTGTYPIVVTGSVISTPLATTTIQQTYGTAQIGAITLATTSASFNGLTVADAITNSGGTFTITPLWSGILGVAGGGTGAGTLTGCLTGNGTGAITGSGTCNTTNATVSSIVAGTGLSGGTITTSGTIAVNTTQNITTLSNLTVAGFVQTTSGGALSSAALTSGQVTTALGFTPGQGTVTAIGVTTNQGVSGSSSGGATPNLTLTLGALTGVTSLNGLVITANTGVITTGTWNGTTIAIAHGGTNQTSFNTNAISYFDGTSLNSSTNFLWQPTAGFFTVGTTSSARSLATLATSTASQLTLTDGVSIPWNFRSVGGSFYLATSSLTTFATSTNALFSIIPSATANATTTFSLTDFLIKQTSQTAFQIADAFGTVDALFNTASTTGSIFTVAATTSPSIYSPIKLFDVDQYGHLTASSTGATPTVVCTPSGGTLSANSNDVTGTITGGTLSTSCTLTFARTYATTPTVQTTGSNIFTGVTAQSTIGFTASMVATTGDVINYVVVQP